MYFPEMAKATGIPDLMENSIQEHRKLAAALELFRKFAVSTTKDQYSGEKLCGILDSFAGIFEEHLHAEITAILKLHDKIESQTLRRIYEAMFKDSEHHSNIFK